MNEIAKLMAQDPLSLTRDNLRAIVEEYRNARHLFKANPKATAKPAKTTAADKAGIKLSLDDLGI